MLSVTTNSGGTRETHTAMIVPRRDDDARQSKTPRERFVEFIVGALRVEAEWCNMRCGIESRYHEPGRARIRVSAIPRGRAL